MISINSVLLYVNKSKFESDKLEADIKNFLNKKNIKTEVMYCDKGNSHNVIDNVDLVITLGGDGTVLQALRKIKNLQIPILAINLGTVGFITEIIKDEWEQAIENYLNGILRVSERNLLKIEVERDKKIIFSSIGVNEGIITSNNIKAIIELKVHFSGIEIGEIHGDGVIIATPTGSTAYSLAAGGPILNPEMNALIFTPICPYSLSNRPMVTSGTETIKVIVNKEQRSGLLLTIDGQESIDLKEDDNVYFSGHSDSARIIMSSKRSFFDVVRTKLKWSGGPRA